MEPKKPQTVLEYIAEHQDAEPADLLKLAIAETEKAQAEARRREIDLEALRERAEQSAKVVRGNDQQWIIEDLVGLRHLAQMYAASEQIPGHYYFRRRGPEGQLTKDPDWGRPNVSGVAMTIDRALRWGLSIPFVLDNSYVFEKCRKLGLEGKLVHAILKKSGLLIEPVEYVWSGDQSDTYKKPGDTSNPLTCTARCVIKGPGDKPQAIEYSLDLNTVRRSRWQSQLWDSEDRLMLCYRTVDRMIRVHCPEILAGGILMDEAQGLERAASDDDQSGDPKGKSLAELAGVDPPAGKQGPGKPAEEPSPKPGPSDVADSRQRAVEAAAKSMLREADREGVTTPASSKLRAALNATTPLPPQEGATQEDLDQQAAITASETRDAIRAAEGNRTELERLKGEVTGHPGLKAADEEMALAEIAGALERCEPADSKSPKRPRPQFDNDHSPAYDDILAMINAASKMTSDPLMRREIENADLRRGEKVDLLNQWAAAQKSFAAKPKKPKGKP